MADFETMQTDVTITVSQATPQVSVNAVTIPAGTALDNWQLSGTAMATVGGVSINVAGTFTYTSAAGTVLGAGLGQSEQVTFTPTDSTDFSTVQTTVTVNVTQITPQLSLNPVNIGYGLPLANNQLSGTATAVVNGQTVNVPGSFAYTTAAGTLLSAGQGQTESVTFTPNDTTDYSTAQANVTVNVFQAAPLVTVNPVAFVYGTEFDNSQLSGTATAVVNGQTTNVAGAFTYTDTSFIGSVLGPPGRYSGIGVTFTPDDTTDFETMQTDVTVTVSQATPQVSVNTVNISTGTALANSQLSGTAIATVGGVTISIAGTLAYTSAAGTVLGAGQDQTEKVTFTPADSSDFNSVQTNVTINVTTTIITPQVTVNPVTLTYGTALANSQLSGTASAVVNGKSVNVPGTFTYTNAVGLVLGAGSPQVSVTFTPTNTTNYQVVQVNTKLTINRATPAVTVYSVTIPYGTALANTQLSGTATAVVGGVQDNVTGTFTYTSAGGAVPNAGTQTIGVTFTPKDTTDFNSASTSVKLVVTPATPTISIPTSSDNPSYNSYASPTFTVVVQAPSGGTPQGTVTFYDGNTSLGTVNLQTVNGKQQASFTPNVTQLTVGVHSITAVYTDTVDSNFSSVTSGVLQQTVDYWNG